MILEPDPSSTAEIHHTVLKRTVKVFVGQEWNTYLNHILTAD